MTHSPPVPPGNKSIYPITEPAHVNDGPPPAAKVAKTPVVTKSEQPARAVGVGAIVGIGALALAAGAYLFRGKAAATPRPKPKAAGGSKAKAKPKRAEKPASKK